MESFYQNLDVWKEAIDLSKAVYSLSAILPKDERFGLLDQMKRASVSIASNIAEGSARGSIADNIRFLYIAKGSSAELETQVYLCKELEFITETTFLDLTYSTNKITKMLAGLISSKRQKII